MATLMTATPASAITWGEVDADQRYPYVGAIVGVASPETGQPYIFCSGSLIHPRVFMTAGHCTAYAREQMAQGVITKDDLRVSFGVDALDHKKWLDVEAILTHPNHSGWTHMNDPVDIGVVILKRPVRRIEPAVLAYAGLLDDLKAAGELRAGSEGGTRLTSVGYGDTLEFQPLEIVETDGLRRFAESEYLSLRDAFVVTSSNQATGDGGSCYGDSGGPVHVTDPETGLEVVVGIMVWEDIMCRAMSSNYRVDTAERLASLDAVIEWVEAGGI
jgi:secreted trypsin-like serine protease